MKKLILLGVIALAACKPAEAPQKAEAGKAPPPAVTKGGPPPIPPYQMRAELPAGDRLAGGGSGETLFTNRCGACHLAGGMGTNLLTKQRMAAGEAPDKGLLVNRTDLTPDYVKQVVRGGKMAMPRQSRVDITDAELESVAAFIGKAK
jgi:mono/diheme cytochrome c family protein